MSKIQKKQIQANRGKRKVDIWLWALALLFVSVIVYTAWGNLSGFIIKYNGQRVSATVIGLPEQCRGRRSIYMAVMIEGKRHSASMTRDECSDGVFNIGDKVAVIRHPSFGVVSRPGIDYPETGLIISFGLIIGLYFVVRQQYLLYREKLRRKKAKEEYYEQRRRLRNM